MVFRCRGLEPSSLTLVARDEREPPRPKAVASRLPLEIVDVATSVTLHGTSPWHLPDFVQNHIESFASTTCNV
jgi:hypothetical protein